MKKYTVMATLMAGALSLSSAFAGAPPVAACPPVSAITAQTPDGAPGAYWVSGNWMSAFPADVGNNVQFTGKFTAAALGQISGPDFSNNSASCWYIGVNGQPVVLLYQDENGDPVPFPLPVSATKPWNAVSPSGTFPDGNGSMISSSVVQYCEGSSCLFPST